MEGNVSAFALEWCGNGDFYLSARLHFAPVLDDGNIKYAHFALFCVFFLLEKGDYVFTRFSRYLDGLCNELRAFIELALDYDAELACQFVYGFVASRHRHANGKRKTKHKDCRDNLTEFRFHFFFLLSERNYFFQAFPTALQSQKAARRLEPNDIYP